MLSPKPLQEVVTIMQISGSVMRGRCSWIRESKGSKGPSLPSLYNDWLNAGRAESEACRHILCLHLTMLQNNCTLHGCQGMDGRLGSIARSRSSIFTARKEATVCLVRAVAKEIYGLEAAKPNEVNRVVVNIMVPFWIPITIRHLIFRVPKKGKRGS